MHANQPITRAIDVRYEKERHGESDRQDHKEKRSFPLRAITYQNVTEDGDYGHENPRSNWDAVPPGSLRIPLRVQYVVHAGDGKSRHRRQLLGTGLSDRRPHLRLQLRDLTIDLPEFLRIAGPILEYAL